MVLEVKHDEVGSFHDGLALVADEGWEGGFNIVKDGFKSMLEDSFKQLIDRVAELFSRDPCASKPKPQSNSATP